MRSDAASRPTAGSRRGASPTIAARMVSTVDTMRAIYVSAERGGPHGAQIRRWGPLLAPRDEDPRAAALRLMAARGASVLWVSPDLRRRGARLWIHVRLDAGSYIPRPPDDQPPPPPPPSAPPHGRRARRAWLRRHRVMMALARAHAPAPRGWHGTPPAGFGNRWSIRRGLERPTGSTGSETAAVARWARCALLDPAKPAVPEAWHAAHYAAYHTVKLRAEARATARRAAEEAAVRREAARQRVALRRALALAADPVVMEICRREWDRHGRGWRYGRSGAATEREISAVTGCSPRVAAMLVAHAYAPDAPPPRPSTGRLVARLRARARAGKDLIGWRVWSADHDGYLVSPVRRTVWRTDTLQADGMPAGPRAGVRYEAGIHACWAPREGEHVQATGGGWCVLGRVRGYGRYVAGPEGWRAERVTIERLWVDPKRADFYGFDPERLRARLRDRYPGVPVGIRRVHCAYIG